MVETLKDDAAFAEVAKKPRALLDFSAVWCGPCRQFEPILNEIQKEFPQVHFVKVDVDACQSIAEQFEIMQIPTIVLLEQGKEKKRSSGVLDKDRLRKFLSES